MGFFIEGMVIGLAIAAPVGPIGVLCIRRTLAEGRLWGLVSGLGAATADAAYGAVAALGLTVVSGLLLGGEFWLRLAGGFFLLFLGARTFLSKPSESPASAEGRGLLGAYASTLVLTLTNPTTILSFAAIFAGLGAGAADGDVLSAMTLVCGVFLGSALWWVFLSTATGLFRSRLSARGLRWVNRVSGTIITAFGVIALSGLGG